MHIYTFYLNILLLKKVATTNKIPLVISFIFCALAVLSPAYITSIYAVGPYDSGYDHGCDDAKIAEYSDRYINQPGKGPISHTYDFMRGYYDGNSDCSESNENDNDDNNKGSFEPTEEDNGLKLIVGLSFEPDSIPSNYDELYFSINGVEQKSHMDIWDAIYPDEGGIDTYFERTYHLAENSVETGESVEVCAIIKDGDNSYMEETCKMVINGDENEPETVKFSFPS